jgi:hypothetical protein
MFSNNTIKNKAEIIYCFFFKFQTGHPLSVQVHVYKQKKVELQYKHKFILHVKPAICFGYKYVAIIRLDVGTWIKTINTIQYNCGD